MVMLFPNTVLEKHPGFGFDVSPDERFIVFTQFDHDGEDLMLIDDFRP